MFYHIQVSLPPSAAKEGLKFIFPEKVKEIEALDTSSQIAFRKSSNELNLFKEWLGAMVSAVDTHESIHPGVSIMGKLAYGFALHGMVRLSISKVNLDSYSLNLDFNLRVANDVRYLNMPESSFSMDLLASTWMTAFGASGLFYQRLNDDPLGIDGELLLNIHDSNLQAETKTACLLLSLLPHVSFYSNTIEEEIVSVARDQCERYKIMTAEDIEFLDDELRFLVKGEHHELSF